MFVRWCSVRREPSHSPHSTHLSRRGSISDSVTRSGATLCHVSQSTEQFCTNRDQWESTGDIDKSPDRYNVLITVKIIHKINRLHSAVLGVMEW